MNTKKEYKTEHYVTIRSKIHPEIYHHVLMDLYCYEKMSEIDKYLERKCELRTVHLKKGES